MAYLKPVLRICLVYADCFCEYAVKGFSDPIEDVTLMFYLNNHSHLDQLSEG